MPSKNIIIIGGGPSGLMAAEIIANAGHIVTIYDRMPSLARKFLMAGRGGLNITHSEPLESFIKKYGAAANWLAPHINNFTPQNLIAWCDSLEQKTFIGSSGRVFPEVMKAAPLLRAWLQRLEKLGVKYYPNHTWHGWQESNFDEEQLKFTNKENLQVLVKADAVILALGGASWPRLGSDGSWVEILKKYDVKVANLRPSNCGFIVEWSKYFSEKFAGNPLKPVGLKHGDKKIQGEIMITANGLEGGAVYAFSALLREEIAKNNFAVLQLDLRPDMSEELLTKKLSTPRGKQSFSTYLRKCGFSPLAINLLREVKTSEQLAVINPENLAKTLKSLPVKLTATTGMAKAISSAGGITQKELNTDFMLIKKPGVFAVGEMLDWEAPTGGYLLQACFSTAVSAANGVVRFLER